ncbi:MAG: 1-acyl-sn-glycerol-3-phosphate acyltransferase [Bacteroidetes bacterium]|nr:1-acyl-sn-glycerol-3-phosphate acyltransferase [Bacteroidota bacterium]
MGIKNIEKRSFFYSLLKIWVDFWHNKIFYRKIDILNIQNIPKKGHLIFTPNHQNALMDALAVLCTVDRRTVFLARSDIFKKPIVASILYFLKILPIYRIRDGYELLKKNKEIFQKTTDVITNDRCALVILPEGNHAGVRRLRPLKKGFARIAFQTEEANNYSLDIHIVPVGIDYEDYQAFRSHLVLNFGKPIPVSRFYNSYQDNPAIGINTIKDALASKIKPLIIHIESEDYYDLFHWSRKIYTNQLNTPEKSSLPFQQKLVKKLQSFLTDQPEKMALLDKQVKDYKVRLEEFGLDAYDQIKKKKFTSLFSKSILLLLLSPLFLYGFLNNIIPYQLTKWASGKIKDPQFKSSFSFVVSLVAFPLFNITQTIVFMIFISNWYWILGYFFSIPLSGVFVWYYKTCFKSNAKDWKIYRLFRIKKLQMKQLQDDYNNFIKTIDSIVE